MAYGICKRPQMDKRAQVIIDCVKWPWLIAVLCIICFTGCFNVDKTQRVELNYDDKKGGDLTPEEVFMDTLMPVGAEGWQKGKSFYITDDKAAMAFDPRTLPANPAEMHLEGEKITFEGIGEIVNALGQNEAILEFLYVKKRLMYPTGCTSDNRRPLPTNIELPMMVDGDVAAKINALLAGKKMWIKTPFWYDMQGQNIVGKKFYEVKVDSVLPGRSNFPLRLVFSTIDSDGSLPQQASVYLNYSASGADSRSLASQFSFSNPKLKYPKIDADVWKLIQDCRVREGMTKEECKLALGSPDDVSVGRTPGYYYDLWQYGDGKYLMFQDGLLIRQK